ncbi:MAG: hypothetical protein ACJATM_001368 [Alphaproteobacteria bacterium]|jgi:hypothetical protein
MKKVPYTISDNSITIFWEGKPYTLRSDHANFKLAEKAILDARYDDLGDLLDISKAVENFVEGEIEVKDEIVYYKGHRLHGVVVDKLLDMLRSGMKDSAPLTNFITRLQANPSANSVNELYSFLSYKSLATTPEGRVLGYKGVQGDFWSSTGNADTIVVQGETNDRHQILNEVGATIEVARRCVDDNKDNCCSFGLHVGSYDYANSWAGQDGRLLLVEFDPQDAVSVPTDCDFQKLRVSKYKVVSDITGTRKELDTPVYEANKPIYGSDENDYLDDEDDYLDEDDYDSDDLDERYDIDEDDSDDLDMDQTEKEEDVDLRVVVADYINKKIINNERVTINHINSLQVCRNHGTRCADILQLVRELSFGVEDNDDKTISALEVSYEF